MSADIIQLNPEAFQTELKSLVKNSIEETLNAMLDEEAKKLVNAERYAREEERNGYRAGHYDRKFTTTAGEVNLRMPKLKGVTFETAIIERYPASFRFHLAADTLAVLLCASLLPTCTRDFHPLENTHAGRTKNRHFRAI